MELVVESHNKLGGRCSGRPDPGTREPDPTGIPDSIPDNWIHSSLFSFFLAEGFALCLLADLLVVLVVVLTLLGELYTLWTEILNTRSMWKAIGVFIFSFASLALAGTTPEGLAWYVPQ